MLASQIPARIPLPFANSGTKNTIPTASQIGIVAGAASFTDGFPPLTFTPLASGGVPPAGADFNGILNAITAFQQWQGAGGAFTYNSAFSTTIGGYPKGATLLSTSGDITWLSIADSNTTDPDSVSAVNWVSLDAYGIGAVSGLTNANVTLTPVQYGKPAITLAGTLTGNVQIIFPTNLQQWRVINNTTGAFTVTCKTAAGTGVVVIQSQSEIVYGDGANITLSNAIGIGQTWQSLTGSRAVNTTYTNSTGKPIVAAAAMTTTATSATAEMLINGTVAVTGSSNPNTSAPASSICVVIPPGATYLARMTGGGTASLVNWSELR